MIEVLHKTKELAIIYKPAGIPTQSDTSGDEDAMSITAKMLSDMGVLDELPDTNQMTLF